MNISDFFGFLKTMQKKKFQKWDFQESYERPLSFDHSKNKELNNTRIIDKA